MGHPRNNFNSHEVVQEKRTTLDLSPGYSLCFDQNLTVPLLVEFIVWSAKYDKDTAADMKFVNRAKKDREWLVSEICDQLKKELSA